MLLEVGKVREEKYWEGREKKGLERGGKGKRKETSDWREKVRECEQEQNGKRYREKGKGKGMLLEVWKGRGETYWEKRANKSLEREGKENK